MFYKYDGKHDGMNRVAATTDINTEINPYGSEPSLDFDKPNFSSKLASFVNVLNEMRETT